MTIAYQQQIIITRRVAGLIRVFVYKVNVCIPTGIPGDGNLILLTASQNIDNDALVFVMEMYCFV